MMKHVLIIAMLGLAHLSFAQPPEFPNEEALETLRFIRLAETKKHLDFLTEDQLLKLNDLLDQHEAKRIENRRQEASWAKRIREGKIDEVEAGEILDNITALRTARHDGEMQLFRDVRGMLNDAEALAFFEFYEGFQRKIRRKIQMLRRGGDEGGQFKRRGGQGRFRN